jgi:hypothetical protein
MLVPIRQRDRRTPSHPRGGLALSPNPLWQRLPDDVRTVCRTAHALRISRGHRTERLFLARDTNHERGSKTKVWRKMPWKLMQPMHRG